MLKTYLIWTLLISLIFQGLTLFATTPSHNFTILPYFTEVPKNIVLQGTGTKFMAWNTKGEIAMFGINGLPLCNINISLPIKQVIWPDYYAPLILVDQGQKFISYSQFTCNPIKTYQIQLITGVNNQRAQSLSFTRRFNRPIATANGALAGYQIDLNTSGLINVYATMDPTIPMITGSAYSDLTAANFVYFSIINKSGNSLVRIWQTTPKKGPYFKEIPLKYNLISDMQPSVNGDSMIAQGSLSLDTNKTLVHSIYPTNPPVVRINRLNTGPSKLITDGNLFDAVVFTDVESNSFQVCRVLDGIIVQNITNDHQISKFNCVDYTSRVLIVMDNEARVVTYSYENDKVEGKGNENQE